MATQMSYRGKGQPGFFNSNVPGEIHAEEAYHLHSEAVDGLVKVYRHNFEPTLMAQENLCRTAALLGGQPMSSAPETMVEVLETSFAKFGADSPRTLSAMFSMAILLTASRMSTEAEGLVRHALELQTTRSRMSRLEQGSARGRPDFDPNRHNIEFPSVFFGRLASSTVLGDSRRKMLQTRLNELYPDINMKGLDGESAAGSLDDSNSIHHTLSHSPGLAPAYAESTFSGADSDATMPTNPQYAESIFSAILTKLSVSSLSSSDYIAAARAEVVDLLLTDNDIRALVQTALNDPKIGDQRLARNFRRLLIEFSKELLDLATSAIANIVKASELKPPSTTYPDLLIHLRTEATDYSGPPRQMMQNFVESLPSSFKSEQGDSVAPGPIGSQQEHHADVQVGSPLNDNDCPADSDEDFSDEEKLNITDGSDGKSITTALDQVKDFRRSGYPMINFKARLRSFVSPGADKRENTIHP
ncbi:hypothetical protein B0H66DRAFT_620406 [Apodospora peruviana]|uniref:Uncharacterized protein n=1 Tax=Apodospora peruviana TaxID=516989 RepID=A0AAE0M7Y9_9PEZI|nr:hypothetical protein B0H66DRAFT_620406 [Apodospora peruviana]